MPLYEYKCEVCGYVETSILRLSETKLTQECPTSECSGVLERQFPLPGKPKVVGGTEKFHK